MRIIGRIMGEICVYWLFPTMRATRLSASAVPTQKVSMTTLRNRTAMVEVISRPQFQLPEAHDNLEKH
jgi:hypothetical protein